MLTTMMRTAALSSLVLRAAAFAPKRGFRANTLRMIAVGDEVPMSGEFMVLKDGPSPVSFSDVFKGKKVALFGVPGAMTPTCSDNTVPSIKANLDALKEKGVDSIAVISVNDPFVVDKWAKEMDCDDIMFLGDGGADFTKGCDIGFDTGAFGGLRCVRMSMLVDDGKVVQVNLEEGGAFTETGAGSSAEYLVSQM